MKISIRHSLRSLIFASAALFAPAAFAFDAPTPVAKVTVIEPTYLPGFLLFVVDQQVANCASGEWLVWDGGAAFPPATASGLDRKANVKAMSNVVLAALHTGGRLRVHARNKPANGNCVVEFIHVLPAQ
jgi:hypothetical protein